MRRKLSAANELSRRREGTVRMVNGTPSPFNAGYRGPSDGCFIPDCDPPVLLMQALRKGLMRLGILPGEAYRARRGHII